MGRLLALLLLPLLVAAAPADPVATGIWTGGARLTSETGGVRCAFAAEDGVRLELVQEGERIRGFASFEFPSPSGSECPRLRKRWRVRGTARAGSLTLQDDAGHEWTLGLRGGALVGLVAWKAGTGRDEPLAEGFKNASGEAPLAQLSGEVSLGRVGEPAPVAAATPAAAPPAARPSPSPVPSATPAPTPAATPSPAPAATATSEPAAKGGGGKGMGTLAIIGANVVGIGAFIAAAELAQDTPEGAQNTCSPRECLVGIPGQGCDCGPNDTGIVTGASCGETPGGIPLGAACDPPARPCATSLSCNSGVCQDSAGACPF
jgi:hypothetical protein